MITFNEIGDCVFVKWLTYQATWLPLPAHAWSGLTKLEHMANNFKGEFLDKAFQFLEEAIIY